MKLATWNVNSIRTRLNRVLRWLDAVRPDVACLEELKVAEEMFPFEALEEVGYRAAVFAQRAYNGVAILSRSEPANPTRGWDDDETDDPQARLIAADVAGIRIVNAYFPNGGTVGSDNYAYKLDWMGRLRRYLERTAAPEDRLILCGDFNVARDDLDVARPQEWAQTVLCHADARRALEEIRQWGFVDVFRRRHPDGGVYSWWDYRMLAFPKNNGLRIDHVFATKPLAEQSKGAWIDRDQRKGTKDDKPSDHAPVLAEFDL